MVAFAAFNTGNNLLFLVLSLMLVIMAADIILSEAALSAIKILRVVPDRVFAGRIFEVQFVIKNSSRWMPCYSISAVDKINGAAFKRNAYFLKISPGETRKLFYRCEINKRGAAAFNGIYLLTGFPFGLFKRTRFIDEYKQITVWPARLKLDVPDIYSSGFKGAVNKKTAVRGDEFWQLRPKVPSDDVRLVCWKSSAKTGRLMVRETREPDGGTAVLILDVTEIKREDAENAVSAAATVAAILIERNFDVELLAVNAGGQSVFTHNSLPPVLDFLAAFDIDEESDSRPDDAAVENIIFKDSSATALFTGGVQNVPAGSYAVWTPEYPAVKLEDN